MPVEVARLLHVVTSGTGLEVGDDAQPQRFHHGDHAFGQVGVSRIVGVGEESDLHVSATVGEVAHTVAVGIGEAKAIVLSRLLDQEFDR